MRPSGSVLALAALLAARAAAAVELEAHVETAGAFYVDEPQMTRFNPGFDLALRGAASWTPLLATQLSYGLLETPGADGYPAGGRAHFLGAGLRVRPLATVLPASVSPGGLFVDFNLGYVRTADLARFGFDVGVGYGFRLAPWFSLGPFVRYAHVVQADGDPRVDPNDAQLLSVGVGFAFGVPAAAAPPVVPLVAAAPPPAPTPAAPDDDGDGVHGSEDRCPLEAGPPEAFGCPVEPCSGVSLLVLVRFAYDSAALLPGEHPVLDAVAGALARDSACRVCVVGHASEEGTPEYNEDLSRRRAAAVHGYLAGRGIAGSRMPTTGFGERCPLYPDSARARPLNRRVEFRRVLAGETCPQECSSASPGLPADREGP